MSEELMSPVKGMKQPPLLLLNIPGATQNVFQASPNRNSIMMSPMDSEKSFYSHQHAMTGSAYTSTFAANGASHSDFNIIIDEITIYLKQGKYHRAIQRMQKMLRDDCDLRMTGYQAIALYRRYFGCVHALAKRYFSQFGGGDALSASQLNNLSTMADRMASNIGRWQSLLNEIIGNNGTGTTAFSTNVHSMQALESQRLRTLNGIKEVEENENEENNLELGAKVHIGRIEDSQNYKKGQSFQLSSEQAQKAIEQNSKILKNKGWHLRELIRGIFEVFHVKAQVAKRRNQYTVYEVITRKALQLISKLQPTKDVQLLKCFTRVQIEIGNRELVAGIQTLGVSHFEKALEFLQAQIVILGTSDLRKSRGGLKSKNQSGVAAGSSSDNHAQLRKLNQPFSNLQFKMVLLACVLRSMALSYDINGNFRKAVESIRLAKWIASIFFGQVYAEVEQSINKLDELIQSKCQDFMKSEAEIQSVMRLALGINNQYNQEQQRQQSQSSRRHRLANQGFSLEDSDNTHSEINQFYNEHLYAKNNSKQLNATMYFTVHKSKEDATVLANHGNIDGQLLNIQLGQSFVADNRTTPAHSIHDTGSSSNQFAQLVMQTMPSMMLQQQQNSIHAKSSHMRQKSSLASTSNHQQIQYQHQQNLQQMRVRQSLHAEGSPSKYKITNGIAAYKAQGGSHSLSSASENTAGGGSLFMNSKSTTRRTNGMNSYSNSSHNMTTMTSRSGIALLNFPDSKPSNQLITQTDVSSLAMQDSIHSNVNVTSTAAVGATPGAASYQNVVGASRFHHSRVLSSAANNSHLTGSSQPVAFEKDTRQQQQNQVPKLLTSDKYFNPEKQVMYSQMRKIEQFGGDGVAAAADMQANNRMKSEGKLQVIIRKQKSQPVQNLDSFFSQCINAKIDKVNTEQPEGFNIDYEIVQKGISSILKEERFDFEEFHSAEKMLKSKRNQSQVHHALGGSRATPNAELREPKELKLIIANQVQAEIQDQELQQNLKNILLKSKSQRIGLSDSRKGVRVDEDTITSNSMNVGRLSITNIRSMTSTNTTSISKPQVGFRSAQQQHQRSNRLQKKNSFDNIEANSAADRTTATTLTNVTDSEISNDVVLAAQKSKKVINKEIEAIDSRMKAEQAQISEILNPKPLRKSEQDSQVPRQRVEVDKTITNNNIYNVVMESEQQQQQQQLSLFDRSVRTSNGSSRPLSPARKTHNVAAFFRSEKVTAHSSNVTPYQERLQFDHTNNTQTNTRGGDLNSKRLRFLDDFTGIAESTKMMSMMREQTAAAAAAAASNAAGNGMSKNQSIAAIATASQSQLSSQHQRDQAMKSRRVKSQLLNQQSNEISEFAGSAVKSPQGVIVGTANNSEQQKRYYQFKSPQHSLVHEVPKSIQKLLRSRPFETTEETSAMTHLQTTADKIDVPEFNE